MDDSTAGYVIIFILFIFLFIFFLYLIAIADAVREHRSENKTPEQIRQSVEAVRSKAFKNWVNQINQRRGIKK